MLISILLSKNLATPRHSYNIKHLQLINSEHFSNGLFASNQTYGVQICLLRPGLPYLMLIRRTTLR
uniref:Uncharacterized protein n=1 Tax=Setaria italica TaxID=4555 RepID=K3XUA9_SETIT